MARAVQLVFFLFVLVEVTVCADVFKLVNSSVQLDITRDTTRDITFSLLSWTFNKDKNIVLYIKNSQPQIFRDLVEFNKETHSLTLNKLQKSDSGDYTAEESGQKRINVADYNLYVLDPVEKPKLYVSLHKKKETCNVTLTCEAQTLLITAQCYNNSCDMKETNTSGPEFRSLSLHISNSSIICNHSNPVSCKNTTMEIKHVQELCFAEDKPEPRSTDRSTVSLLIVLSIIIIIIIIIFISVFIIWNRIRIQVFICHWWHKRNTKAQPEITSYEEVGPKAGEKRQSEEMSNNLQSPPTVYYTVGMPGQTCSSDEGTMTVISETSNNKDQGTTPQTIYATVSKVGKPE